MEETVKILLCEDDENLGMLLREYLQTKGFATTLCPDGEAGFKEFTKNKYDIAVLDVMMPKKDGFTLAQEIRQQTADLPIVFLTAKTLKEDILEGFKIGADDYITKPFGTGELLARVEAVCRRIGGDEADSQMLSSGDIRLDLTARCAYKKGEPVELTQVELQMLRLFIENAGKALSRETILEAVWGRSFYGDVKVVDVNVRRLRVKIEDDPAEPQYITTVWGFGYRWNA